MDLAIVWLQKHNYNDIEVEVKVPNHTGGKYRNSNTTTRRAYFAIDVVGRDGHKKIAVECGGSKSEKLDALLGVFNEVWVLPYAEVAPFRWQEGIAICQNCGHII